MSANGMAASLLEIALRGGVALAVAAAIALALGRRSAALRHAVWRTGVVALLLAPAAVALLPRWPLPVLPGTRVTEARPGGAATVGETRPTALVETTGPGKAASPPPAAAALLTVWIAGAILMGGRMLGSHLRLAALGRTSRPLDDPRLEGMCRVAERGLGLRFAVRYRTSARLSVPLACGWLRPTVLLPDVARGWSEACLRGVLVHELSHLERRDPLWLGVARLARALHWYHPLAWLALRRIEIESERACDDAVVRAGERPSGYAETLLFVAALPWRGAPDAALAFLRPAGLEARIEGILASRRNRRPLGRGERMAVALAGGAFGLLAVLAQPVSSGAGRASASDDTPRAQAAETASWTRLASDAVPTPAEFRDLERAPVRLGAARVRIVRQAAPGRDGVTLAEITLGNRDPVRRVTAVQVAFDLPTTRDRVWEELAIPPAGMATLRLSPEHWSVVVPAGDAERLVIRLTGARFADGSSWDAREPGPVPPPVARRVATPPPAAAPGPSVMPEAPPDEPSIQARFRNPAGAAVVIVDARTPEHAGDRLWTWLPRVQIENRTARRIVALRLRYKAEPVGHAVSGFEVQVEAHGTAMVHPRPHEIAGRAEDMTVQLLGARFDDGTVWGTMDSLIHTRDAWVEPLAPGERR